ncbi:MAG: hypothetical protein WCE87_09780 [Candidatus Udaeobacter sp.]
MSESVAVSFVALLLLSFVFVTCSYLDLLRRKVSRALFEVFGLFYVALVLSILVFQVYRPAPVPVPNKESLFYGPTDWTPKGNPRAGIG